MCVCVCACVCVRVCVGEMRGKWPFIFLLNIELGILEQLMIHVSHNLTLYKFIYASLSHARTHTRTHAHTHAHMNALNTHSDIPSAEPGIPDTTHFLA